MEQPTKPKSQMRKIEMKFHFNLKNLFLVLFIGFLVFSFFISLNQVSQFSENKPLSQVLQDVKDGKIRKLTVEDVKVKAEYKDGQSFETRKEAQDSIYKIFESAQIDPGSVEIEIKDTSMGQIWVSLLSNFLPLVLMVIFFLFLIRQARGAQDNIFSFGQSRAKLFSKDHPQITFANVAGVDEAKKELEEVVDFLKHPGKYRALGARTPKGAILVGPAGTGKTLLARAVAGEAGVPFFSIAGSEFMEMLVGVGAARVRDLFLTAKKSAPAIIFIDEIDAIGRVRSVGIMGGHDEREQTLNQILVEMDGFAPNEQVVVVAASVTRETPILIKQKGEAQLVSIGEFVDRYYSDLQQEGEVQLNGIECLGFERKRSQSTYTRNKLYFGNSTFKQVRAVFRHRVNEIYEIDYLGGRIRATGNHSVFIRSRFGIEPKAVSELTVGDVLVDLPFKVNRTKPEKREIRAHRFLNTWSLSLPLESELNVQAGQTQLQQALLLTIDEKYSSKMVASSLGVSQTTISNWLREKYMPRLISKKLHNPKLYELPPEIPVTENLCRLLGYYVAEGYSRWELDFCFSITENELIKDTISLMESIFGLLPKFKHVTPGAVNLVYHCAPVAHFFARICGKGAHHKHVPAFLFEAPYKYFKEFLKGIWLGDGYEDKRGRGELTTVSQRLVLELNWLAHMHGLKTYMGGFTAKAGRRIGNGKPLKAVHAWRLGWGKAVNPFNHHPLEKTCPAKRAVVKKVTKLPYTGFVYDLCGVDNEAFFGGESPVLLHNTNRGDLLDPALLRPGRFDRRVVLDMPDIEGRKAILEIHMKGKPFTKEVDWDKVARRTVGFSGADLENMLNEAAIAAARGDKRAITMDELEEAATKVKLGPEKKRLQSDLDRKMTAYHEAGHAIVTHELPYMDPVHRISIVSRGMALGFTLIPPTKDRVHETKSRLLDQITSMLGGRAAEELVFNEFTTGVANDIDKATAIARQMVIEFGMSSIGPINFGPQMDVTEWGKSFFEQPQISPEMMSKIDGEVKKIIDEAYKGALAILKKFRRQLDAVAEELVKKETLDQEEFEKVMGHPKNHTVN